MLENPSSDAPAPAGIATIKRYAPPNQRFVMIIFLLLHICSCIPVYTFLLLPVFENWICDKFVDDVMG